MHGETEGGLTMTTKIRSMRVDPFERPREGMAGFKVAGRYRRKMPREKRHYEESDGSE